ncbi:MAG: S41 family peptidase [Actinomycetes bacterium]|jgi:carboxyl-terminal processing protease|nr:S41 family peptidase [Actinomycetes bacterium]
MSDPAATDVRDFSGDTSDAQNPSGPDTPDGTDIMLPDNPVSNHRGATMNRITRIIVTVLVCMAVGMVCFVGGFLLSQHIVRLSNQRIEDSSDLTNGVRDAYYMMQKYALEPADETTATIGAINGLLTSNGDAYARYLPASAFESYSEDMSGEFGGIGVLLGEKDGTVYVVQVYPDTPAAAAGIQTDDYFYGVDGETKDDWTSEEISSRVRGEVGTSVELTLLRPRADDEMPSDAKYILGDPYSVTVKRDKIESPNTVTKMLDGDIGYVRLYEFNQKATDELSREYEDLIKQGARGLILDLRENPGGDLQEAIGVSSLFIDSGAIVQIESRDSSQPEILKATGDTLSKQLPLICLVDANSASASEIVSGALQDYDRAKLVGTVTYGKGSVQTQLSFGSGAIFMTTAHYLTAKGRVINGIGNTPDVAVEMDIAKQADESTDTQLQRALSILQAQLENGG